MKTAAAHTMSNTNIVVDSGAAIHVCPSLKSADGDVLRVTCSKSQISSEQRSFNRSIARPILAIDLLNRKGVLVVFGDEENSSCIQLPDGHKNHMIRENAAKVLNATLVDET